MEVKELFPSVVQSVDDQQAIDEYLHAPLPLVVNILSQSFAAQVTKNPFCEAVNFATSLDKWNDSWLDLCHYLSELILLDQFRHTDNTFPFDYSRLFPSIFSIFTEPKIFWISLAIKLP